MTPLIAFYLMTGLFFTAMVAWGASSRQYKRALADTEANRDHWIGKAESRREKIQRLEIDLATRDRSLATMKAALKHVEAERSELKAGLSIAESERAELMGAVKGYQARPRVKEPELTPKLYAIRENVDAILAMIDEAKSTTEPAPIYG